MQTGHGKSIAYWIIAGCFVAAYSLRHIAAGYIFPVPWPDEAWFLWQAIGFQHANTLFAPELNPMRDIFWMPPGYMIAIGALFKISGMSFALARAVSFGCMTGVFLLLAAVLKKHPAPLVSLLLLGTAFLSLPVVAAGNVARMDAMLMLTAAAALFLFLKGCDHAALALVAISPLIHPNGVCFCAGALAYFIWMKRWKEISIRRADVLLLCFAGIAWLLYIAYATMHWGNFLSDMMYQFHRKGTELHLFSPGNISFFLVLALIALYGIRQKTAQPLLTCFAIAMWGVYIVGKEMWYESFYGISMALLFCAFYPTAAAFLRRIFAWNILRSTTAKAATGAAILCIFILGAFVGYRAMPYHGSITRIWTGVWSGMKIDRTDVPYMTEGDIAAVKKHLQTLQGSPRTTYVRFYPEGDALFFADMETANLRFDDGVFTTFPAGETIVHVSRHTTNWWDDDIKKELASIGVRQGDTAHILLQRDSTEIFYYGETQ